MYNLLFHVQLIIPLYSLLFLCTDHYSVVQFIIPKYSLLFLCIVYYSQVQCIIHM